ncbi:alpha/beta fold hydrolase [Sphingosinicella sp. CPCC 101087]|uniref:alpha/beta fold hydrolase n=1 Tax=Sphingosinicella sp. CPCC 101087 TaxID=2497754 RepID=UPI00101BA23E|nr:alpha/beta hydrolase [Sphingosinicella sp. CPCC 101087]
MRALIQLLVAAVLSLATTANAQASASSDQPTIVLVHGAFAESSSWNDVITSLKGKGHRVIAAANPLRSVSGDSAEIASIVRAIEGPVILVGHSYGGVVITEAAEGAANVRALVYVAAFLPEPGESSLGLSTQLPGSTLGAALMSVALPGGGQDLYIRPEQFHAQFAADVAPARAALMAATQRPVTQAALVEPSRHATWRSLPTYMIYGSADRNIPPAVMRFMAERAGSRRTVVIEGASHALMLSHAEEVARLIEEAAQAR